MSLLTYIVLKIFSYCMMINLIKIVLALLFCSIWFPLCIVYTSQYFFSFFYCFFFSTGAIMCVFSLFCALALSFFDKRADRILKRAAVTSGKRNQEIYCRFLFFTWVLYSLICGFASDCENIKSHATNF